MTESIKTPTVAETINDEYLQPLGLSAADLAQAIHVPAARIKDILHGSQEITADISLRLAKFFGVSDAYLICKVTLTCGMPRSILAVTCQQLSLLQRYRPKIRNLLTNFLIQIKAPRIYPSYNSLI
ncbi:HigA family addiction module antitoxin [Lactobacillus delbrueckii subsp. bulgaricus]